MIRIHLVLTSLLGVIVTTAACTEPQSPVETQQRPAEQSGRPKDTGADASCKDLPSAEGLRKWLRDAPGIEGEPGGLFSGTMEWASIVDRQGQICVTVVSTDDPASSWPGSQAIAKAKAYTANAFSTDAVPLSTARLYTLTQPGHSLWGLAQPNAFNPDCLQTPGDTQKTNGRLCGGTITFGGGVPLYRGRTRVGGLGISGDTACADHEMAKRIRHMASLDPEKGELADDIIYATVDGASPYAHPLCANTWRNGKRLGDETPGS